jgi:hypothetical protein
MVPRLHNTVDWEGGSMNRIKHLVITLAVVVSFFLTSSQTAYASIDVDALVRATHSHYLGVGTMRILVQVLAGVGIGLLAIVYSVYRTRIRGFFSKLRGRGRYGNENEESE